MALAAHADQYFVMMMNCNHLISAVKLLDSSLGLEPNQHLQTDLSNPTSLPLFRLLSFSLPPAISLSSLLPSLCLPSGYSFHNTGECLSLNEMEMEDY